METATSSLPLFYFFYVYHNVVSHSTFLKSQVYRDHIFHFVAQRRQDPKVLFIIAHSEGG